MTTLLIIVIAALILIIINQININITTKARIIDLETQNKYLEKPLYNITIYAEIDDKEIYYRIKDNLNTRKKIAGEYNLYSSEAKFTTIKEAEEFISEILIKKAITIENTFDCSTIKMN